MCLLFEINHTISHSPGHKAVSETFQISTPGLIPAKPNQIKLLEVIITLIQSHTEQMEQIEVKLHFRECSSRTSGAKLIIQSTGVLLGMVDDGG